MRKIRLFIAMSLDGYIADSGGGVHWLEGQGSDEETMDSYSEFAKTIDTVLMGWNTYHQIVTELSPKEWVYQDFTTYVFTHHRHTSSETIRKNTVPELVCEKMREFISEGVWEENTKVPSEAELAEMFGVNRFTVRMALQKLNTLGVLETRMGDGTYVRPFNFEKHLQDIYQFYMTPKLLEGVSEFRAVV